MYMTQGITNQFPFVDTIAKSQYKLVSLSVLLYIESDSLYFMIQCKSSPFKLLMRIS